jgi:hypothetical protein
MIKLQHDVPLPKTIRPNARGKRRKYPFEEMEVGSFFFLPGKRYSQIGGHLHTVSKQLDIKLQARVTYMCQGSKKEWSPCEEGDAGATLGVGVWRTE